jgi:hypothetical protein
VVHSPETVAVIAGVASAIALKILEYLLPKGHHFKFMDRWITQTKDDSDDE